ncbi:alpha-1,2-glucosyltransferase Alg10 isoform X2 [Lycorma delicatula]|uniref:alpha-1,2-glucosyltransferase Alg10 isoform X2 n=1 Tax=Lycorma delicatula TaxID=130591 RepID=UPI003F517A59
MLIYWDPKITTLPGVYLLSVGVIKPLAFVLDLNLCSTYALRVTNLVANAFNFLLFYLLLKKIYSKVQFTEQKILFSALNMAIFPPLYFFSFFYYTEPVSTMLLLLAILLHLQDYFIISSLIGLVSVITRQTNIVWVSLLGLDGVIYVLNYHARLRGNKNVLRTQSAPKYIKAVFLMVYNEKNKLRLFIDVLKVVAGYAFVLATFCAFLIINKGIVIGDKQQHVAAIHFPQFFYFTLYYLFFTSSFSVVKLYPFYKFLKKNWKLTIFSLLLCSVIVYFNTLVHPYLLADNRHYTFYIWNRVYGKYEVARYIFIPVYIYGLFCIYDNINHLNFVNQLGFFISAAMCLVPQKLVDVRYFIFPYLLLRLQIKHSHWWQLLIEFFLNIFINILTIYIFITKTFYWSDFNEPQRIMW